MSGGMVQSLSRGLSVLELLAPAEQGLSLQELCDRLEMKPPTMHNLLRTLAARGFVEKSRRPVRYRLGPAPLALVERHAQRELMAQVEAALRRLVRELPIDHAVYIELLGGEMCVTRRVLRSQPDMVQRTTAHPMAPYTSASGLLLQAWWPADDRDAYRRRYPFDEYGHGLWSSLEELEAFLAEVRRVGYSMPPRKPRQGVPIAVPVHNALNQLVGGLGAYRRADSPNLDDADMRLMVDTLISTARDLRGRA